MAPEEQQLRWSAVEVYTSTDTCSNTNGNTDVHTDIYTPHRTQFYFLPVLTEAVAEWFRAGIAYVRPYILSLAMQG